MFPADIDPTTALLNLINEVNPHLPTDISLMNVTFGPPELYVYEEDSLIAANTTILLTPKPGSGMTSQATIYYRRYELNEIFTQSVALPNASGVTSWEEFLSLLNATYNLQFTTQDIPTTPFAPTGTQQSVVFTPNPNSYLYMGTATFLLNAEAEVPLEEAVTETVLDGLTAPEVA